MKIKILFFLCLLIFNVQETRAFWIWTPETNRWINPKYAVKDTPQEQLEFGESLFAQEDYASALREFQKLIRHYPKSREAPQAQFYIAETYENLNQSYRAFQEYQKVIEKYPFSDLANEVVERQYLIGERLLQNPEGNRVIRTIMGSEYDVIDVFRTVIRNAPYGPHAPVAQYKIGLYLAERNMYQEARDELERVVNDYPQSEWAKAARYQIALVDSARSVGPQYDQAITRAAVEQFEEFVESYPDAQLSERARREMRELRDKDAENNYLIAHFYHKQRQYQAAKIYYTYIIDHYSESSWAQKAHDQLAVIEKRLGQQK